MCVCSKTLNLSLLLQQQWQRGGFKAYKMARSYPYNVVLVAAPSKDSFTEERNADEGPEGFNFRGNIRCSTMFERETSH